jgi:hypothetical protein
MPSASNGNIKPVVFEEDSFFLDVFLIISTIKTVTIPLHKILCTLEQKKCSKAGQIMILERVNSKTQDARCKLTGA